MLVFYYILLAICAYFVGNLNFAIFISRKKHNDITKIGSGNPGSMNMIRNFGVKLGALTLLFDTLKALVPALIGYLCLGEIGLYVAGCSEVIGHIFPVFHHFKGGKGIASSFGIFWVANPILATIMFVLTILAIILFKYGSVATLTYVFVMSVVELCLVSPANWPNYVFIVIILFLVFFSHRGNIKRLLNGTEAKTIINFKRKNNIQKNEK